MSLLDCSFISKGIGKSKCLSSPLLKLVRNVYLSLGLTLVLRMGAALCCRMFHVAPHRIFRPNAILSAQKFMIKSIFRHAIIVSPLRIGLHPEQ